MMDNRPNKKVYILSAAAVLLLIFLIWLLSFLQTGKIIITTNNPNDSITISNPSNNKAKTYTGQGRLEADVRAGQYLVVVESNSLATRQVVTVSPHKTQSYVINPINPTGVEPVAYQNAQNIAEDASKLLFINTDSHKLYKIDNHNNLLAVVDTQLQNIKWSDASFGIGQDSSGHLYVISNGALSQLSVPFSYSGSSVGFDVSPDKKIYVSYGSDVYSSNQNGNFKKIYTATSPSPELAAGKNEVAVVDSPLDIGDNQKIMLAIVNDSGKIVKKGIEAHRLAWSPSGQYLLDEESQASIYNASLQKIATLPASFIIGSASWLDESNLVYSNNDQLWIYNLPDQKAQILANMPLANYITGLSISDDKAFIYLTTLDSTGHNPAIRRVGLKNQSVPKSVYQLQSILPLNLGQCTLRLINFAGPTVLVQSSAGQSEQCLSNARTELLKRGFDLNTLQITAS